MRLIKGDCIEELKNLENNSVDSIVTDPPYELGFMGKKWDNTGIAYNTELWKEALRVLKPGGHLLAFSGTRTYHRMAVAIEDAGFEIRDMVEWIYSTGFPKSLNVYKQLTKTYKPSPQEIRRTNGIGTALKPAHEPVCLARKPLEEKTVAENVLKHGTGGINIDECRVEFISEADKKESTTKNQHEDFGTKPMTNNNVYGDYSMMKPKNFNPPGRFPANLIHDGSDEVVELFPNTKSGAKKANQSSYNHKGKEFVATLGASVNEYQASVGSAARFFYVAKASKAERNRGCEGLEEKEWIKNACVANRDIRPNRPNSNNHPTVKPIALMKYLIKLITPKGGIVLDPFMGSGSTGIAAVEEGYDFIGIEREEEYLKIAESRINSIPQRLI